MTLEDHLAQTAFALTQLNKLLTERLLPLLEAVLVERGMPAAPSRTDLEAYDPPSPALQNECAETMAEILEVDPSAKEELRALLADFGVSGLSQIPAKNLVVFRTKLRDVRQRVSTTNQQEEE
jgi:hypothetical protein